MLTHLRITDYALIDDVEISFGPGFNVLSGETGAGKSLLVEAVSLLRGGRISADVVRAGAEEARIEAVFEPPHGPAADALRERLTRANIEPSEEGLVVRRVIARTGRGRVYINNTFHRRHLVERCRCAHRTGRSTRASNFGRRSAPSRGARRVFRKCDFAREHARSICKTRNSAGRAFWRDPG